MSWLDSFDGLTNFALLIRLSIGAWLTRNGDRPFIFGMLPFTMTAFAWFPGESRVREISFQLPDFTWHLYLVLYHKLMLSNGFGDMI